MTNALVEIGLITSSVVLGILGLPVWAIGIMVGASLLWWGFVHRVRIKALAQAGWSGALQALGLAFVMMALGHSLGFGMGKVFAGIMGLK